MGNSKLSERIEVSVAIDAADIAASDLTSGYVEAKYFNRALAVLKTGVLADTKKATIEFVQAKNASGLDAKILGAQTVFVAGSGGAAATIEAEVDLDKIDGDGGFTHIAVKVGSDGTSITGAVALVLGDYRYRP